MTRFALLAALLTACVNAPTFNGIEDQSDAGAADAAPEVGTATVFASMRNGSDSPQPDVHVVFTDASGTITFEGDTDGTGIAAGQVVEGGTLFAAYASPAVLVVITKIKPGETYHIGEPRYGLLPRTPAATMSLTKYATSTIYKGLSRCGGGAITSIATAISMVFTWTEGCSSGETVGVMATAADAVGAPIASKYIEVPYAMAAIANTGAFVLPASVDFKLTAPSDLLAMSPTVSVVDHQLLFGGPAGPMIAQGETTASLPYFVAGPSSPLQLTVDMAAGGNKGSMQYYGHLAPQSLGVVLDLSAAARPQYLSDLVVPTKLELEPAFSWSASPGQPSQVALLAVVLTHPNDPPNGGSTIRYVFEPTDTRLMPPPIPALPQFAAFQPDDSSVSAARIYAVRFPEGTADYAVARQVADRVLYLSPTTSMLGQQLLAMPAVSAAFVSVSQ